jgi:hypothetical protein
MAEADPNIELQSEQETRQVAMVSELLNNFERNALLLQRVSLTVKSTEIILAGLVPVLIAVSSSRDVLLAVSTGLAFLVMSSQLWQFDAQWRQYRLLVEQLRREIFLFRAHEDEYSIADDKLRSRMFFERTTKVLESQYSKWFAAPRRERAK